MIIVELLTILQWTNKAGFHHIYFYLSFLVLPSNFNASGVKRSR